MVLLNQGGGRFVRSQTLTVGIGLNLIGLVASMDTADVNGDHRPDLLVVDQLRGVVVLIGRGNGTFTRGAILPIHLFESPAVGDLNHDGIVDVAIPDTFRNSVAVFLGRGDGTFAPPIVSTVNLRPGLAPTLTPEAAIADFNGDGDPDLIVSGGTDRMVHIMLGDGTGQFTTTESYPAQIARTIVVDDFNHDGRPDLAITQALGGTEVLLHN